MTYSKPVILRKDFVVASRIPTLRGCCTGSNGIDVPSVLREGQVYQFTRGGPTLPEQKRGRCTVLTNKDNNTLFKRVPEDAKTGAVDEGNTIGSTSAVVIHVASLQRLLVSKYSIVSFFKAVE